VTNINTHDFANNFADQNFLPDAVKKTHHYMFLATTPEKIQPEILKKSLERKIRLSKGSEVPLSCTSRTFYF
jgi:hypothetical protein